MSKADRNAAFESWKRRAADADILDVALSKSVGAVLKKAGGREHVGPCPACGGKDRFSINVAKGIYNCRGAGGGDVIAMVMHACSVDFLGACEIITGEPPPTGAPSNRPVDTPEEIERRNAEREARNQQREADENLYRERERGKMFEAWRHGVALAGSPAEAYLKLRGIAELPSDCLNGKRLRCIADMPYYDSGKKGADEIHRGPALLAPIVGAERIRARGGAEAEEKFSGLHVTYLDLSQPKGKLSIFSTNEKGEKIDMDAKKVRGSQAGGHIVLVDVPDPKRLIIGEGIEKTLAVWCEMMSAREITSTAFWTSVNLQNLGGKATGTILHPSKRNPKTNRRDVVQGPYADMSAPGIVIPESVEEVLILGDGSSDRFMTECAIARAAQRFSVRADGTSRIVRVAWSPPGMDFDEMRMATEMHADIVRAAFP